ncbi:sigma-54-dependent Fis family transcriptional regulator [Candidatus Poribacteria bacterium]|nr:sigma-54-dependent Fis family transcriptional regulator [Candidatus Poribacteria bacterium]
MTILVIDDDSSGRTTLAGYLRKCGYRVLEAASGEAGLMAANGSEPIHVVLSDIRMPGIDGIEVLRRLRTGNPELAVLLVTAFASVPQAVEAVKIGAWDYLPKPIDLDELRVKLVKMERELGLDASPDAQDRDDIDLDGIVAESPAMQDVLSVLDRAAPTDATILLLGESGTGKSMLSGWVHRRSARSAGPFVSVSCAALPETLIESELFGHEKGAFTGADRERVGRFEAANGGTLFLDEVGDIPLATQVKLLHVLQERVVARLGGSGKPRRVDVRVVAATNRNLQELIREGRFREDLYYRLNVVSVEVPPLRLRRRDVPALVAHFLAKHALSDRPATVSPEAESLLARYAYPGNVRELENAIERAAILARNSVITPRDLPPTMNRPTAADASDSLPDSVETLERQRILEALHAADGIQTRAAESLGITERNLRYKMRKYRIATARGDAASGA